MEYPTQYLSNLGNQNREDSIVRQFTFNGFSNHLPINFLSYWNCESEYGVFLSKHTILMAKKAERRVTMGQVFKTIIWPRRKHLFLGLFLIIISRLASLVLPGASKYLIDDVI